MSDTTDLQAQVQALTARLAALEPEIRPNWAERGCTVCGAPADVIDVERPVKVRPQHWNGEGYCAEHAAKEGVTAEDHPHLTRPGPKRKGAS
jgi:hypothetical protein